MKRAAAAAVLAAAAAAAAGAAVPAVAAVPDSPGAARGYRTAEPVPEGQAALAAAAVARWPSLRWSPTLARAALLWSTAGDESHPPVAGPGRLEATMHAAGSPDPTGLATALDPEDLSAALDQLAPVVAAADPPFTHLGLARLPAGHSAHWAAVLVRRRLELEPVPARVAPGSPLRLRFRLAAGLDRPTLVIAQLGRSPRQQPAQWREGAWEIRTDLEARGTVWLILDATGPRGPEVVATFPVGVGIDPQLTWTSLAATDSRPETRLFELVNVDRARHGLPQLAADPVLDRVARDHSRDMATAGFFSHQSPTHGGLTDRLAAHRVAVLAARENIAEAADAGEAERSLMMSPTHRANILAPEVAHLGVGIAPRSPQGLIVTQVFARPQALRDPAAVRALFRGDDPASAPADTVLDTIATDLARAALTERRLPPDALDRVRTALAEAGIGWSSLRLRYLEVAEPEDAAALDTGGPVRVGVGVAGPIASEMSRPWATVLLVLR